MSIIKNARDILLQASTTRLVDITLTENIIVPAVKAIVLTAPALTFKVTNLGVATPTDIVLTAELKQITGTVNFAVTSGTATLTGSGLTRTLSYSNMSSTVVTITASVTENSVTYTSALTISKVVDGADGINGTNGTNGINGTNGQRGYVSAIRTVVGLTTWSNTEANTAISSLGYTNVLMDRVTLRDAVTNPSYIETRYWSGTDWLTIGQEINGNLLVTGTVTSDKIGTNTLSAVNINTSGQIKSIGSFSSINAGAWKAAVFGENLNSSANESGIHGYGYNGVTGFTSSSSITNDAAALVGRTQGNNGIALNAMGYIRWQSGTFDAKIPPPPNNTTSFLRADGTWSIPPNLALAPNGGSDPKPANLGTASVGTGTTAARSDHVHAIPSVTSVVGYTPVQQGTGIGQLANAVKIGWNGSNILLQVDNTNFGVTWPISINGNAATATTSDKLDGRGPTEWVRYVSTTTASKTFAGYMEIIANGATAYIPLYI